MNFFNKLYNHCLNIKKNNATNIRIILSDKKSCLHLKHYFKNDFKVFIQTKDEFLIDITNIELEDNIILIKYLHDTILKCLRTTYNKDSDFEKFYKSIDSFEKFFELGTILLNDFEDIEANLIEPKNIFTFLSNKKKIDKQFYSISEQQEKSIKEFGRSFNNSSFHKSHFLYLWEILPFVYNQFNIFLSKKPKKSKSYLYKEISEKIKLKNSFYFHLKNTTIIFAGFSILTKIEKMLFKYLEQGTNIKFFGNFDNYYLKKKNHPLYNIANEYLNIFSNLTNNTDSYIENKKIKIIETNYVYEQVTYLCDALNDYQNSKNKIAIVVPNDKIKKLLIGSLEYYKITFETNNDTLIFYDEIFIFLESFIYLHIMLIENKISESKNFIKKLKCNKIYKLLITHFNDVHIEKYVFKPNVDIINILNYIIEKLKYINDHTKNTHQNGDFILKKNILKTNYLNTFETVSKKIQKIYRERKTPLFSSNEFLTLFKKLSIENTISSIYTNKNLAILSFHETRYINFEQVYILGFTNNVFKSYTNSFITSDIKKAYDIPLHKHLSTLSNRYLFLDLISRTKNITIFYNLYDIKTKKLLEPNKFLLEILYEEKIQKEVTKWKNQLSINKKDIIIYDDVSKILMNTKLSASGINIYLDCSLKFYFKYVKNITKKPQITESIVFGELVHKTLNNIYSKIETIENSSFIANLLKNISYVLENILKDKKYEEIPSIQIIKELIMSICKKILEIDKGYTPFNFILSNNKQVEYKIEKIININDKFNLNLWGIIDRIDKKKYIYRIIDYKTGNYSTKIKSIENLFDTTSDSRNRIALQLLFYCYLFYDNCGQPKNIKPYIVGIKDIFKDNKYKELEIKENNKYKKINNFSDFIYDFKKNLKKILTEILNPEIPFSQTSNTRICKNCEYNLICKR